MLGSRLIAAVSAGAGAIAGMLMYNSAIGQRTDMRYALTLFSGRVAGAAVINVLTEGAMGRMSAAIGTGAMEAGGMIASTVTTTASRVMAVVGEVSGALVADCWYSAVNH